MSVNQHPAGRPRILVVEDDPAARSALAELLEKAGYTALVAGTVQDGARIIRDAAPDLLITDVRLGEFNGLQLVVMNPRPAAAIVVTGFDDPVLEAEARRAGADYLVKPLSFGELLKRVEQKLATPVERATGSTRRWARKPVGPSLPARVEDLPARIVDVSYGGLRFEIARTAERMLPSSFDISLPTSDFMVHVDLVWQDRHDDTWLCGAQVSQENDDAARAWRGLVDAVS